MKMVEKFYKMSLGDIVHFGNGKSIKPGGQGQYPVYGSNGIIGGSEEYCYENGIIIGRVGAYCGAVTYCSEKFWASDNTLIAFPASDQIDIQFLYYLLISAKLTRYAGGAAQPLVTQTVLKQVEVNVPSKQTQHKIVKILSSYDYLIENSFRRIKILEEMARSLYREWFVHYRYPGHEKDRRVKSAIGEIPEGWEIKSVKEVATVTYGFPFASKKFNTNGLGKPIIRIRDILESNISTFTEEEADPKYYINDGDILVGMDGEFHMCIWSNGLAWQNQRIAKFQSMGNIGNYHLFLALIDPIKNLNSSIVGTTVAHLGDSHIRDIQIVLPKFPLIEKMREILEPMSQEIILLKHQISNLRNTRDLLLPRLMAGQVNFKGN